MDVLSNKLKFLMNLCKIIFIKDIDEETENSAKSII